MKAFYLSERENTVLQKQLKTEYVQMDYLVFVNNLMFMMQSNYTQTPYVRDSLLFVLNKIFLDNLFLHVIQKSADRFCTLIRNKTFGHDIHIRPFYTAQIFEAANIPPLEDTTEIENAVNKRLYQYVRTLYANNTDALNVSLMEMFEYLYTHFHYLDVSHYKFELMNFRQPILLLSEKCNDVLAHSQQPPHQEHPQHPHPHR